MKLSHERVVGLPLVVRLIVGLAGHELPDQQEGQYHPHHAERICHGTAQGGPLGRKPELVDGLLGGAERRGVGGGPAEDADHVGHRDGQQIAEGDGCGRPGKHKPQPQHVELYSPGAERAEESRAHLKAKLVDKQHEAEVLGVFQYRRVDGQAEVSGHDTGEEHKRDPQRDAADTQLPQSKPDGDDDRDDTHGLQGRLLEKQTLKPIHTANLHIIFLMPAFHTRKLWICRHFLPEFNQHPLANVLNGVCVDSVTAANISTYNQKTNAL